MIATSWYPAQALVLPSRRAEATPVHPVRIALVSCSAQKLDRKAPARDLYCSPLFKLARRYAELTCDAWFILSAKHGVVDPARILEPYDRSFGGNPRKGQRGMDVEERRAWIRNTSGTVHGELCDRVGRDGAFIIGADPDRLRAATVVLLAGEDYAGAAYGLAVAGWRKLDLGEPLWKVEEPLAGKGVGERLSWLSRAVRELENAQQRTPNVNAAEDKENTTMPTTLKTTSAPKSAAAATAQAAAKKAAASAKKPAAASAPAKGKPAKAAAPTTEKSAAASKADGKAPAAPKAEKPSAAAPATPAKKEETAAERAARLSTREEKRIARILARHKLSPRKRVENNLTDIGKRVLQIGAKVSPWKRAELNAMLVKLGEAISAVLVEVRKVPEEFRPTSPRELRAAEKAAAEAAKPAPEAPAPKGGKKAAGKPEKAAEAPAKAPAAPAAAKAEKPAAAPAAGFQRGQAVRIKPAHRGAYDAGLAEAAMTVAAVRGSVAQLSAAKRKAAVFVEVDHLEGVAQARA